MNKLCRVTAGLLPLLLLASLQVFAQKPAETKSDPNIEQGAMEALKAMSEKLRGLKSFSIVANSTQQIATDDGQRIDIDTEATYAVKIPGHMMSTVNSVRKHRSFYYDGETLTVYIPREHYYAQAPMTGSISSVIDKASEKFGIELPLSDLFHWGTERAPLSNIKGATVIGPALVDGSPCIQLAFRQEDVDWQLWISDDEQLPRRMVIVDKTDPAFPQYSVDIKWDTTTPLTDGRFTFVPGPDDHRIKLDEEGNATAPKEAAK